jgi:L-2-hydroxyglutarate oxidase LhgO
MDTDVVIIGAGAVGLAISAQLASNGYSVILLEKEADFGRGVSSRSSEVIHAGIYYHTGSLKASLCLQGKNLLYEHCAKHKVSHKKVGKLFLAVLPEETKKLEATYKQAVTNGVDDLAWWEKKDIAAHEPSVKGSAALFSPSSGIFDSHGFMKSLFSIAKSKGMIFSPNSPVEGAEKNKDGWTVNVGGQEPSKVACKLVINSAGLYAIDISKIVFPGRETPVLYPSKGSYTRYSGKAPVSHIIYPSILPGVIEERVDATPDLGGSLRFGPNIETSRSREDFTIEKDLVMSMLPGIKRYLPGIDDSKIQPDCAGIRPKIYGPKDPVRDFVFDWAPVEGWLDLWGIESPGLTCSLSIARHVLDMVKTKNIL